MQHVHRASHFLRPPSCLADASATSFTASFVPTYLITSRVPHHLSLLQMLANISRRTAPRTLRAATVVRAGVSNARRNFVQPSGADRASVVDVPAAFQDDLFTPRPGEL
jgi:hypothetical protein